ncbi:ABC transporter ATP-binding protein [Desulfomonile tiedjei]|uniref:ABC-type antimicrobial peptide transport system, ATPase component n=1 Tax=Desulfomonile tiedjei (strain ATCC 49306 / DSM 6799 / DCB-1) TaxID=706587 RepID=I4CC18_DESTA|nr:ABC transporter ATP-binding protein [Desulfomonile tiedjei]AFM27109.1 ABC-type antimicrobial peptide transport system, ATPase component [Desulfomonile tiedjei DSM 6799]
MSYIVANQVAREFGQGENKVTAVRRIDLSIGQSEFISIMGESGAGKSTLLSMLGGLLSPTKGEILVGDINIYALKRDKLADFRREFMGFIFQSFQLVPYLNVIENVQLPLAVTHHSEADKKKLALSALERVGLKDKALRLPNQLSGGEQERVAIARAVVNEPPILFADEPTGNLDSRNSEEVMNLLKRLNSEGQTIVMVTHSRRNAEYADRIVEVADGCISVSKPIRAAAC